MMFSHCVEVIYKITLLKFTYVQFPSNFTMLSSAISKGSLSPSSVSFMGKADTHFWFKTVLHETSSWKSNQTQMNWFPIIVPYHLTIGCTSVMLAKTIRVLGQLGVNNLFTLLSTGKININYSNRYLSAWPELIVYAD